MLHNLEVDDEVGSLLVVPDGIVLALDELGVCELAVDRHRLVCAELHTRQFHLLAEARVELLHHFADDAQLGELVAVDLENENAVRVQSRCADFTTDETDALLALVDNVLRNESQCVFLSELTLTGRVECEVAQIRINVNAFRHPCKVLENTY